MAVELHMRSLQESAATVIIIFLCQATQMLHKHTWR